MSINIKRVVCSVIIEYNINNCIFNKSIKLLIKLSKYLNLYTV